MPNRERRKIVYATGSLSKLLYFRSGPPSSVNEVIEGRRTSFYLIIEIQVCPGSSKESVDHWGVMNQMCGGFEVLAWTSTYPKPLGRRELRELWMDHKEEVQGQDQLVLMDRII